MLCFAALACLAACNSGSTAASSRLAVSSGSWAAHVVGGVSLSIPSSWNTGGRWSIPGTFSSLVGSFSNQALSSPCSHPTPNDTQCGAPIKALQRSGILVEIFDGGAPAWTINDAAGAATTVSGLPARVLDQRGQAGSCAGLGGDLTREEVVGRVDVPDNYFQISICSLGIPPSVGDRILSSVRVTSAG